MIANVRLILREVMVDLAASGQWIGAEVAGPTGGKHRQDSLAPVGIDGDSSTSLRALVIGR